jgi:hypothetical protein
MLASATAKDWFVVSVASGIAFVGLFFVYHAVRAAVAPSKLQREILPNWRGGLGVAAFGACWMALSAWVLWATRERHPHRLHTFRSLADAHEWALRAMYGSLLIFGLGFFVAGLLPSLAAWFRKRRSK